MQEGTINQPVKKGQKTTVRLLGEETRRVTAETNITSNPVLVVGDRIYSKERFAIAQQRTNQFFQSKVNPNEDEIDYPWAYLFSIDDLEAIAGINYTDPSWNLDHLEGHFKSFGDGGGDYATEQEMLDDHAQYIETTFPYYAFEFLEQHENRINIFDSAPQYIGIGDSTLTPIVRSDGVDFFNMQIRFGANEKNTGINSVPRPIYPTRQYFVTEQLLTTNSYAVTYNGSNSSGEIYTVNLTYLNTGSLESKAAFYNLGATTFARYAVDEFGTIDEAYRLNGNNFPPQAWIDERRNELLSLLFTAEGEISAPNVSGLGNTFNNQVFTGQQILDGEASIEFSSTSGFPSSFQFNGATLNNNQSTKTVYISRLFLIPISVDRNPGIKNIYCQVRDNRKILLHQIPTFEVWDGYISPLPNQEIEVVLRCGKKIESDRSLSNYNIQRGGGSGSIYDRKWSQTRVYRLSSNGAIINSEVYNNSNTLLNPSETPDTIIISPDNWQKSWLETYDDWRTEDKIVLFPSNGNLIDFRLRIGTATDLSTGYRTYLSELLSSHNKAIANTNIDRLLSYSTGYGTLTPNGFVYLDPTNLFDRSVELDYSFSFATNFFPSRNYAVFSGLAFTSVTKSTYFIASNSTYENDTFSTGISLEKATNFPPLDLKEEYNQGVRLPEQITSGDWDTEWSTEPGIETNLLRFAIKAIGFLG